MSMMVPALKEFSSKGKVHVYAEHCSWWNQERKYPWKWQQWIPLGWRPRKGDWKGIESGRTIPAWLAGGHSWQVFYEASFFISKKKRSLVLWANLKGLGRESLKLLCREQNWRFPSRCCNAAEPGKMDNGGGRGVMPENLTHQAPCHLQAFLFVSIFSPFSFLFSSLVMVNLCAFVFIFWCVYIINLYFPVTMRCFFFVFFF